MSHWYQMNPKVVLYKQYCTFSSATMSRRSLPLKLGNRSRSMMTRQFPELVVTWFFVNISLNFSLSGLDVHVVDRSGKLANQVGMRRGGREEHTGVFSWRGYRNFEMRRGVQELWGGGGADRNFEMRGAYRNYEEVGAYRNYEHAEVMRDGHIGIMRKEGWHTGIMKRDGGGALYSEATRSWEGGGNKVLQWISYDYCMSKKICSGQKIIIL